MTAAYEYMMERRREVVATLPCPRCLAPIGTPCLGKDEKPRKSSHSERMGRSRPGPRPQPTYPVDRKP